jgi:flagellar biogenesis protein FliO
VTTVIVWAIAAALVAAGVAILRARQARSGGEAIRLVTSRYLGAKRFLTIVEVDGERLLLGLAGDQVSLVARLGGADARHEERA